MKLTRILMVLGVLLLAVGFVGVPMVMNADGAMVVEDEYCFISSIVTGLPGSLTTYDSHAVLTPSGNVKLTCHFEVPEAWIPEQPIKVSEGFSCSTGWGSTPDIWVVVDTEGYALLRCQIKAE